MLTTLENLKTYLGITDQSEDAKLTKILESADRFVKNYCRRNFEYDAYDELVYFYKGLGLVKETPVESIQTVETLEGNTLNVYKEDGGIITLQEEFTGRAIVSYLGGYKEIPGDLELAVLRLCEYFYLKPEGVTARDIPAGRLQFGDLSDVISILDRYRRVRI